MTCPRRRDRAAAAMLYLSGMRVGAFSTLPIQAVDLSEKFGQAVAGNWGADQPFSYIKDVAKG